MFEDLFCKKKRKKKEKIMNFRLKNKSSIKKTLSQNIY